MLLDLVLWPPTLISTTPIWLSLLFHHKPFFPDYHVHASFLRISPFHSISFAHPLPPFLFSSIFQPLFSFLFMAHVSAYPFLREFPQTALAKCVAPHCKLSPRQFPTLFYMFPVCCPFHSPQHPSEVVLAPWHSGGNWGTEQWNSWSTVIGLVWGRTKLEPPCWTLEPIIL